MLLPIKRVIEPKIAKVIALLRRSSDGMSFDSTQKTLIIRTKEAVNSKIQKNSNCIFELELVI